MERKIRVFDKTPETRTFENILTEKKRIKNNLEIKCKSFGRGRIYISSDNKTAVEPIETLSEYTIIIYDNYCN